MGEGNSRSLRPGRAAYPGPTAAPPLFPAAEMFPVSCSTTQNTLSQYARHRAEHHRCSNLQSSSAGTGAGGCGFASGLNRARHPVADLAALSGC